MRKKRIVIAAAAVAAVAGVFLWNSVSAQPIPATAVEVSPLARSSIRETVSASGFVESAQSVNVYAAGTSQAGPVTQVLVKAGDQVQAGDVLCTLDPQAIEDNIRQTSASLQAAQLSADQSAAKALQAYQDEKDALDKGLNSQINAAADAVLQAQQAQQDAQRALQAAQKAFDDEKATFEANLDTQLLAAQATLQSAKTTMDRAEKIYRERRDEQTTAYKDTQDEYSRQKKVVEEARDFLEAAQEETPPDAAKIARARTNLEDAEAQLAELKKELDDYEANDEGYDEDDPTRQSLRQLREAAEDAQAAYSAAYKNLEALRAGTNQRLSELEKQVEDAQIKLENAGDALAGAQRNEQAAQLSAQQSLQAAKQAANDSASDKSWQAQETELEILQQQLAGCTVTAPVSGTVTAVYAEVGAAASGVLFVIEDTDALQVRVEINEYDVARVWEGMQTKVRADAIDGQEFDGVLTSISPAAVKDDPQAEAGTRDVRFEAIVTVTQAETPLRIGMSAKTDIITEEKQDVYTVPFESIAVDDQGQDVVYTVEPDGSGQYIPQAIPVETGLEGDYNVEISGDGLSDGIEIVIDGKSVVPGMPVSLPDSAAAQSSGEGGAAQ